VARRVHTSSLHVALPISSDARDRRRRPAVTELALTSPRVWSGRRVLSGALVVGALAAIPAIASPFQAITICYGLVFAIAAPGFQDRQRTPPNPSHQLISN